MASAPDATLTRVERGASAEGHTTSSWALPADLLTEAVRRLRAVAWLYAISFALAGPLIPMFFPEGRALLRQEALLWVPAVVSVAGALGVVALLSWRRPSDRTKVGLGLAFEVLGSVGIAYSEYHHISAPIMYGELGPGGFGLSWVAVWVMLFSVVVPVPPRLALISDTLALATVPLVYLVNVRSGLNVWVGPDSFFFNLVFPYLIVLAIAYGGACVVYRLGTAVREARDLGSYRLVERLGKGAMGEVWRARHQRLVRPAAIKLIRPEVLGAQDAASRDVLLRRFEREAQATALMRSSHTLQLYDYGVTADGVFYHVMELLDGFDLRELVSRFGPVPPARAVHFLRQICDSLGEAHAAGLIHRDVKPANIYVCRYGREVDFIKVLDFGLVKQGTVAGQDSQHLTADQTTGGTPAFMSPEQALGGGDVDGRSDLYAVGCVAYWLLTGTNVFEGRSAMETIVMHVHARPEPPSSRTAQPIPAELEAIVMACLAKDPADRPQTAEELAARVAAVPLPLAWTSERAREWWTEHRPAQAA
jgi:eukaryotic-like serine/threonine-protein kinase